MSRQLTFNLYLPDNLTFDNFYGGVNDKVFQFLRNLSFGQSSQFIYLWGAYQTGRTHLLLACCNAFSRLNSKVFYLSFKDRFIKPEILDNLDDMALLCLDDLDKIIGDRVWEEKIFHCFNSLLEKRGNLIVAADRSPRAFPFILPDLKSRLSSNIIFQLHPLSDEQKINALILRTKRQGFNISREVAYYLLNHYQRDLKSLFAIVEKLAKEALYAKRAFTIPFTKEVLEK